ncbi:MAG: VWA domain-containing protein [Acidobacteria bacterium]|nr:VWA domain-containing protein [Acidobacteriota bacterium]
MRRLVTPAAVLTAGLACSVVLLARQGQDDVQTFRTGVDLIRLDVSVLDKARRPVRGLAAGDFTVLENGRPQRIVAVTEVNADEQAAQTSAWIRHTVRDVTGNDLADQLDGGRALAIVLDEANIPIDSAMQVATRDVARHIVDVLGPTDLAAIVFPLNPGKTQDFTNDRQKLYDAIDRFKAEQRQYEWLDPDTVGPRQGDMRRYSSLLNVDPCLRERPAVPALRAVTSRLATVPNQRKAVFFVSVGVPLPFSSGRSRCQSLLYDELRATYREAQRANVNINTIDPGAGRAFADLLQESRVVNGRMTQAADTFSAHMQVELRHDFLETAASQTGGRAVASSETVREEIDQIFAENASYYLVGYETSNAEPDGKFRRVEVKVNARDDVSVRASGGYWAPDKQRPVANERREAPSSNPLNVAGLPNPQGLVLRVAVHPVARVAAAARRNDIEVAAVVSVRVPAPRQPLPETLTLVRTIADSQGRTTQPVQEVRTLTLEPLAGDTVRYEVWSRFALPPGHYEVRFNAASKVADSSGSVYVPLDVPDLSRNGIIMSSVVLGTDAAEPRADPFGSVIPIVPTAQREFAATDRVRTFLRVFQGGTTPLGPVTIDTRLVGADDRAGVRTTETIPADRFDAGRSATFAGDVPLNGLPAGMYLMSVTATLEGGRSTRRDVVFRVR